MVLDQSWTTKKLADRMKQSPLLSSCSTGNSSSLLQALLTNSNPRPTTRARGKSLPWTSLALLHGPTLAVRPVWLSRSLQLVHPHQGFRRVIRNFFDPPTPPFVVLFAAPPCHEVKLLSCVRLFATPQTVAYQAPLSMGFSRQQHWTGLPFPSPGDLPDPGIQSSSPALAGGFFYH